MDADPTANRETASLLETGSSSSRTAFSAVRVKLVVGLVGVAVVGALLGVFLTNTADKAASDPAAFRSSVRTSAVLDHLKELEAVAYAHPSGSRSILNAYEESAQYVEKVRSCWAPTHPLPPASDACMQCVRCVRCDPSSSH